MTEWKLFSEEKPECGLRVVYFRDKIQKFSVGKCELILMKEDDDTEYYQEVWINEHTARIHVDPNDWWIYLTPLRIVKNI